MLRGFLVWCLMMAVETVHGVLRGMFLAPSIGGDAAAMAGWPVAALLVIVIATATIRWTGVGDPARLAAMGAVWAVLTLLFEVVIGVLRGLDAASVAAALSPTGGTVTWSAALMAVTPLLADRIRRLSGT